MALSEQRKQYLRELYRRNLKKNREKNARKAREWRLKNSERARENDKRKRSTTKYKERVKVYSREYARRKPKDPVKVAARTILNNAILLGKMKRPLTCENCNQNKRVHGHHHDYSKPLEVKWLCTQCHAREHHPLIDIQAKLRETLK